MAFLESRTLKSTLFQRVADLDVHRAEPRARKLHPPNDDHCDQAGDESVFDRRGAVLAAKEFTQGLHLSHLRFA